MAYERNTGAAKQSFDPHDTDSYNFGDLSRPEANAILLDQESGVFLIRSSSTKKGDLVLCVVEDRMVSHYIINYKDEEENKWVIGTNKFPDIPSLLTYYTTKILKSSTLIRPAKHTVYIAKCSYIRKDPTELSFEKGSLLTLYYRDADQRYKMKNETGIEGLVDPPHVEKYVYNEHHMLRRTSINQSSYQRIMTAKLKKLPALAVVRKSRIPNAYDSTALRLTVGDRLLVHAIEDDGMWEGELESTRQRGMFPFTFIEFLEDKNSATTPRKECSPSEFIRRGSFATSCA